MVSIMIMTDVALDPVARIGKHAAGMLSVPSRWGRLVLLLTMLGGIATAHANGEAPAAVPSEALRLGAAGSIAIGAPGSGDGAALPCCRSIVRQRFAQAAPPQSGGDVSAESVGIVSSLQGSATVTRASGTVALKVKDEIFKGDVVKTAAASTLGIVFDDETTFSLTANASISVDDFVYAPTWMAPHQFRQFEIVP